MFPILLANWESAWEIIKNVTKYTVRFNYFGYRFSFLSNSWHDVIYGCVPHEIYKPLRPLAGVLHGYPLLLAIGCQHRKSVI